MTTDDRLRRALEAFAACVNNGGTTVNGCDAALATLDEPAALRVGQRVRDPAGNVGVVGASMSPIVRVEYHDGGSTAWGERSLTPLPDAPAIDTSVSVGDRFDTPMGRVRVNHRVAGKWQSLTGDGSSITETESDIATFIRDGSWRRLPRETVAAAAHADAPPPRATDARQVSDARLREILATSSTATTVNLVATELLAARERLARQAARIEDYVRANASLEEGLAHATAESDALERERDAAIARCEALIVERAASERVGIEREAYAAKLGERTKERDAALAEHNAALAARDDLQTEMRRVLVLGAERLERMRKAERELEETKAHDVEHALMTRDMAREILRLGGVVPALAGGYVAVAESLTAERDSLRAQLAARPPHAWSDAEVERMAREAWDATERHLGSSSACEWDSDGEDGPTWCRQFARHILVHASPPPPASAVVDVEALARYVWTMVGDSALVWEHLTRHSQAQCSAVVEYVRDAVLAAQALSPAVERLIELAYRVKLINPESLITDLRAALAELDGAK